MVVKQKGFTLIELMLATSLLMLVLFAGYYGYGLFTERWQKRTQYYWQQTQQSLAFDAIARVFESAVPYIVTSDNNEPAQYFSGDESRVIFITNSPLFNEKTSVVEFKILQQSDSSFSLAYNEASMESNLLLRQSDEITWQHQVILMDKLKSVSFDYYGWESFSQAIKNQVRDEDDYEDLNLIPSTYKLHVMERIRILPMSLNFYIQDQQGRSSQFPVGLPTNAYTILVEYLRLEV